MALQPGFEFIDLFSGIGGFHQALASFGGDCVLASDIDEAANAVYKSNYGIDPSHNIREIKNEDVPDHEVLCAGFPCQAFSKAGKQEGFLDQVRGTLFFEVARILEAKRPPYFLLENVQNLVSHDKGRTYNTICETLKSLGYRIPASPLILQPYQFGVPQIRPRVYIPGAYDPSHAQDPLELDLGEFMDKNDLSILPILEENVVDPDYALTEHEIEVLNCWDDFHRGIDVKVIGFPIWYWCFDLPVAQKVLNDPETPEWKAEFIKKNMDLYQRNRDFIDQWKHRWKGLKGFTPTEQKFEWQVGNDYDSVWDCIIQSRPSGIRVKRPTCFQALVAMVQTPIVGPMRRYMTVREAARLQSFPETFIPDSNKQRAFKQLGNSVNVEVLRHVISALTDTPIPNL